MSQINVHDSYFDNIKSKRLCARFGELIDVIPIRLWCYAAKHHPTDGLFKNYSEQEICSLINYSGDSKEMLLALLEFGFLDKTPEGWYKVHEWEEYQGHIISFSHRGKENAKKRWDLHRKNANSITSSNAPTYYTNQLINNTYAEQVQLVFNHFCTKLNKKILLTPERKKIIEQRLKEKRTVQEINIAIDNFSKDEWPDRHKYCDIVYAIGTRNKVNNLDRWLNQTSEKKWDI